MPQLKLHFLYRDDSNYKTHFDVVVDASRFGGANNLKVDDTIEMGTFGSPSKCDFFSSDVHPYPYDDDKDHNLLEIEKIEEVG